MEWIRYANRADFTARAGGVPCRGVKWSDAPAPGSVWAVDNDRPKRAVLVRKRPGERYEIEGEMAE